MRMGSVRAVGGAVLLLVATGFVIVPEAASWSDGTAGGTAQIPEHLRECAEGFNYCRVKPSACGGCHGSPEDMRHQRDSEFTVSDRIGGKVVINANPGFWEYEPGQKYFVEISIKFKNGYDDPVRRPDARPLGHGEYSEGAFALNVSRGRLDVIPGDDSVRITGGIYTHFGSHNDNLTYDHDNNPGTPNRRYGATEDNETRHLGEAVNTYEGSMQYSWSMTWTAPRAGGSMGAAFQATVMVPNGNGWDDCVWVECNQTKGYSDQSNWDWWSTILEDTPIPRMIAVCEAGAFPNRQACAKAVQDDVLPPTPPPDTNRGGTNGPGGPNPAGTTPVFPLEGVVALAAAAGLAIAVRRRR